MRVIQTWLCPKGPASFQVVKAPSGKMEKPEQSVTQFTQEATRTFQLRPCGVLPTHEEETAEKTKKEVRTGH